MYTTDELTDENRERERSRPASAPQRLYEHLIREPIGNSEPHPAVCVGPTATVSEAIALMKEHGMGCVLVEQEGQLLGIFTERDVLFRVAAADRDARSTAVAEVMTPDPETLTMSDRLAYVLNLMAVGGFRHVPILDDDGHPVAVFSVKHIVERLVEFFPNEVLNLPPHPGKNVTHTREGA
jgi:CBS domain-containing protein